MLRCSQSLYNSGVFMCVVAATLTKTRWCWRHWWSKRCSTLSSIASPTPMKSRWPTPEGTTPRKTTCSPTVRACRRPTSLCRTPGLFSGACALMQYTIHCPVHVVMESGSCCLCTYIRTCTYMYVHCTCTWVHTMQLAVNFCWSQIMFCVASLCVNVLIFQRETRARVGIFPQEKI